jgi:hypothetical protein
MLRHGVAESFVMVKRVGHICVSEQRPAHEFAVGNRAAATQVIIGRTLIAHHFIRFWIPIRRGSVIHGGYSLGELGQGHGYREESQARVIFERALKILCQRNSAELSLLHHQNPPNPMPDRQFG